MVIHRTILKPLDFGHTYRLDSYDGDSDQVLQFMKREGENYPGNVGSYPGTNMQEVIRVLIDRLKYVDNQKPHYTNILVIQLLRNCLYLLELRTKQRRMQSLFIEAFATIENLDTCSICGHVQCTKHKEKNHAALETL
jgi:hypothetical protein